MLCGGALGGEELGGLAHLPTTSCSPRSQRIRAGGKESLKAKEDFSRITLCSHLPQ